VVSREEPPPPPSSTAVAKNALNEGRVLFMRSTKTGSTSVLGAIHSETHPRSDERLTGQLPVRPRRLY